MEGPRFQLARREHGEGGCRNSCGGLYGNVHGRAIVGPAGTAGWTAIGETLRQGLETALISIEDVALFLRGAALPVPLQILLGSGRLLFTEQALTLSRISPQL